MLWDIDAEGLSQAQAELTDAGYEADVYICNLAEREEIADVAARTLANSGPVDILVNNEGVVSGRELLDISDQEIERTFQVNALALFWTVRAFLPSMLARDSGHLEVRRRQRSSAGWTGPPAWGVAPAG